MSDPIALKPTVKQVIPFLWVSDLDASLRFYIEGLGFIKTREWVDAGKLRWCWLQLGGAALMLQEYLPGKKPAGKLGEGVSVCFQCADALALYRDFTYQGIATQRPFVGNAMWVTLLSDPDGYKLDFESPADAPEESLYTPEA